MGHKLAEALQKIKTNEFKEAALDLEDDEITNDEVIELAAVLKQYAPPIKEILLNNNDIKDGGAKALAIVAAELKMESLEIESNNIGPDGASDLMSLGKFRKLNLSGNPIQDGDKTVQLKEAVNIEELDLSECELTNISIEAMGSKLTVTELNLTRNWCDDEVFNGLATFKGLQGVILDQNKIECENKESLKRFLSESKALTSLDLSTNSISNPGAKILSALLSTIKTPLVKIDLAHNQIGNEGLTALATLVSTSPTLQIQTIHNPGSKAYFDKSKDEKPASAKDPLVYEDKVQAAVKSPHKSGS